MHCDSPPPYSWAFSSPRITVLSQSHFHLAACPVRPPALKALLRGASRYFSRLRGLGNAPGCRSLQPPASTTDTEVRCDVSARRRSGDWFGGPERLTQYHQSGGRGRVSPSRSGAPAPHSRTVHQIRSGDRDSLLRGHTTRPDAKNPLEASNNASMGGGNRNLAARRASMLGRIRGHLSPSGEVLPRAGHELTSVGFFESKNVRDLAVWVVERFPKHVRGSFRRRELFQQYQNRECQCLAPFRFRRGVSRSYPPVPAVRARRTFLDGSGPTG